MHIGHHHVQGLEAGEKRRVFGWHWAGRRGKASFPGGKGWPADGHRRGQGGEAGQEAPPAVGAICIHRE